MKICYRNNVELEIRGAKTVPRILENRNTSRKNNDFMLFSVIENIENTIKNAIEVS